MSTVQRFNTAHNQYAELENKIISMMTTFLRTDEELAKFYIKLSDKRSKSKQFLEYYHGRKKLLESCVKYVPNSVNIDLFQLMSDIQLDDQYFEIWSGVNNPAINVDAKCETISTMINQNCFPFSNSALINYFDHQPNACMRYYSIIEAVCSDGITDKILLKLIQFDHGGCKRISEVISADSTVPDRCIKHNVVDLSIHAFIRMELYEYARILINYQCNI